MKNRYYEYIGKAIKEARDALDMTQQEVADKIGVKRSLYSQYERGTTISMKTWIALAEVLQLDPVKTAMEALAYERSTE